MLKRYPHQRQVEMNRDLSPPDVEKALRVLLCRMPHCPRQGLATWGFRTEEAADRFAALHRDDTVLKRLSWFRK